MGQGLVVASIEGVIFIIGLSVFGSRNQAKDHGSLPELMPAWRPSAGADLRLFYGCSVLASDPVWYQPSPTGNAALNFKPAEIKY